jgi:hypothetical protein
VQVTVEVHAASWDVQQYILSQLQQQQQQQQPPAAQADTSRPNPKVFGPYAATLSKDKYNTLHITQLQQQHEPQTFRQHLAGKPHRVVLQERVSAWGAFSTLPCVCYCNQHTANQQPVSALSVTVCLLHPAGAWLRPTTLQAAPQARDT